LTLRRLPRALKRLDRRTIRPWQKLIERLQSDLKRALLDASVEGSGVSGMAIALSPHTAWVRVTLIDVWPVLGILTNVIHVLHVI